MVAVHLRKIGKLFGATRVVGDVNIDIASGELFFLLGPSGCGKTTCLRMVAGFYYPDEGEILFDERSMTLVPPHQRNTGMVFQQYALWPHLTVAQNVGYGLTLRHVPEAEARKRVMETLEAVHMEEHAAKFPNQLSGGQQQRISLARALVIRPDVLLLDEPLSNLDAKLRLEMRTEIRRLQRETKITAIYVTHDQAEALTMADRMAIMDQGSIVQIGNPREVYTAPANTFVAGFIGETNFLPGSASSVNGGPVSVATPVGVVAGQTSPQSDRAIKVGDKVTCSVRPEALTVSEAGGPHAEGANVLRARVVSSMYLGSVEEFVLELVGDGAGPPLTMKALMHNPGRLVRQAGHEVELVFDPKEVVVLAT
jgi:iron(III) transport system ATP-binding protein